MRDDDEARMVMNSEPVIPLGPSVCTGPTGHPPEAGPAVDVTAVPRTLCLSPAPGNRSYTARNKAARPGIVPAKPVRSPRTPRL